jgi:5-formyltetrahydrofolate cyclo-ligase
MNRIADKSAMRRDFRKKRDNYTAQLSSQDNLLSFSVIPSVLKSLFNNNKIVSGYVPMGSEASPLKIISNARSLHCDIVLPFISSKISPILFLEWQEDEELVSGPFGLRQPNQTNMILKPDIILVPLIAFDRNLNRLGQGAGHYDRALSVLDNAIAIGIAWSVQEADCVPADPWDIPLDAVLTEKEWICR